jgi:hypothetical protein
MNLSLPCLVALTLLLCGAVAALPTVVRDRPPQPRPLPAATAGAERLRIVLGPGQRWYLNGEPIPQAALAARLARSTTPPELRFLPSASLPMAAVGESLGWLRRQNRGPVLLELPPDR